MVRLRRVNANTYVKKFAHFCDLPPPLLLLPPVLRGAPEDARAYSYVYYKYITGLVTLVPVHVHVYVSIYAECVRMCVCVTYMYIVCVRIVYELRVYLGVRISSCCKRLLI